MTSQRKLARMSKHDYNASISTPFGNFMGISPGEMMRNSPASEVNNDLNKHLLYMFSEFSVAISCFSQSGMAWTLEFVEPIDIVSAIVMVLSQQGRTAKDGDWGMVSRLDAEHGTAPRRA